MLEEDSSTGGADGWREEEDEDIDCQKRSQNQPERPSQQDPGSLLTMDGTGIRPADQDFRRLDRRDEDRREDPIDVTRRSADLEQVER